MDNPNPIKYSDLIQPDNSITNLIQQLEAAVAAYEAAKSKIQSAASETAKGLHNVSGASEEQRKTIQETASASERLLEQYKKLDSELMKAKIAQAEANAANREFNQISKLMVEINQSVEGSYKRLSAQYRLNKIALNEMSAEERANTEYGRQLETETRKMYEEMSRLQKATGKYTLEVGHYENALKGLPGPVNQVVSGLSNMRGQLGVISSSSLPLGAKALQSFTTVLSGTIGLIMIFVRQLTGSAKTLREFEQANVNLSTILGVTRDDMKGLTDAALLLGRTTEYTARQVTQLQTELAKLGFGQGSIIAMEKPILQFATAVGANLADAASVAGSTLRAFNLTSADTEDVLATLAVATNKSALSFDRIQQSIGTVFPVANAFGLSVKDATALLGALANAGFDASSAATATRNILLNLSDANGKLAKSLGGPARSFDEIINGLIKLRKSGTDLNEALQLTDKRSVAAFTSLLSGVDSAKELRESLEDVSGELERIQSERLNTVEGQTKLLKSAWEGLTLAFQESNGAIKDTIVWLTRLVEATQAALFPKATAISDAAKTYTARFQEYYKQVGGEEATAYINEIVANEEKRIDGLIAAGQKNRAKRAQAQLDGIKQAANIVISQIDNDTAEAERQAKNAQEQARQNAQQRTKEEEKAAKAAAKQRIADRQAVVEAINLEISVTEAGTDKMLQLRLDKVEAERQLELERNRQKVETERQDEQAINDKYDKMAIDARKKFDAEVAKLAVQRLQAEQQAIQLQIAITEDGTEEMLDLRLQNIEKQRQIEIEQNKQKAVELRQDEAAINKKYDIMKLRESAKFNTQLAQRNLAALQDRAKEEFDILDRNERQKTLYRLQMEEQRLLTILEINKTAVEKMTKDEVSAVMTAIANIQKQRSTLGYNNLYELLGIKLDSNQQDALNTAIDSVKDTLASIVDSWNEVAEAAIRAADAQVDSAQKALDAEIEARNAGYANNVETARKELEQAKKTQAEALKERERAQKAQIALDSAQQSSSLITATANIWKALSGVSPFGTALAIAAITTMWGSFAASKVKAVQAVKSEQYGEGTVELLQGGSHASGHDVDLGRKPNGTRRRAEGGEFFAIINKRNSRKYRSVIPDVINSFNNGTFADRYQRANAAMAGTAIEIAGGTDITALERDVAAIRKQGDETRSIDGKGNTIIKYKNLTRKIYKN